MGRKAKVKTIAKQTDPLVGPAVYSRLTLPTPSPVYDTYWRFAHLRQEIFWQRVEGNSSPWTEDEILQQHRFTNVYRASDRVSQYLIRKVIYEKEHNLQSILFRILIFKIFNRIETWELLEQELGEIQWDSSSIEQFDKVLSSAMRRKERIYSAAYIVPPCSAMGGGRKHLGHLKLIGKILNDGVVERMVEAKRFSDIYSLLRTFPMLGPFLAYQFAIDINYSTLIDFSENDFVMPGPGARDGIRKVFEDPGQYSEEDLIRYVADRQEREFSRLTLPFRYLPGRRLHLIDCQNLFCEVDKYARVRHPQIEGLSGRTRIKQKYSLSGPLPKPWFPPKWGINDLALPRRADSRAELRSEFLLTSE